MNDSTTSLMELPIDPAIGGGGGGGGGHGGNGMQLNAVDLYMQQDNNDYQDMLGGGHNDNEGGNLDEKTISLVVNGLQQAIMSGSTQLKSRDIPSMTQPYTQDAQIQPTYLPPFKNQDYIQDMELSNQEMIKKYQKKEKQSQQWDELYDEIQIPLLLCIIYFIFQLPFFNKYLFQHFPSLFFVDGNLNIHGFLFKSALFGVLYYILMKVMNIFQTYT